MLDAITDIGFEHCTPIQAETLPFTLACQDLIGQAQTGTGKTAAFLITAIQSMLETPIPETDRFASEPRVLALAPTRELAMQIAKDAEQLCGYTGHNVVTVVGGMNYDKQRDQLQNEIVDILVATPGRLIDFLGSQDVFLDQIDILILDEADRMLDMGFADDIDDVISYTPPQRQTLLFSATYPAGIERISARVQRQPLNVEVEDGDEQASIEQRFYETTRDQRPAVLVSAIRHYQPASCVVFCNTKRDCQSVYEALEARDISCMALHGDLEQRDRDQVLVRFANRSCRVLVATDVAARGLDIKELELVVNYELSFDPEVHVHRIGRTGRAGLSGLAISLCTPQEMVRVHALEEYLSMRAKWSPVSELSGASNAPLEAEMVTLCIDGGRKAKIRPGDILGALTGDAGLTAAEVGKIDMFPVHAYVAIRKASARKALQQLQQGKIKGKSCKVRLLK
ncbi:MAG: ATP-dependent RNA helicase DbpA [Pseudomonadota bacterium]